MHLINVTASPLKLQDFSGRPPPYAIVSHTWGEDEVTYQEFLHVSNHEALADSTGFKKIQLACNQARNDGLDFVWIDTCCIDKSSSAELSEAINSMFNWYRRAARCYAYLSDVPAISLQEDGSLREAKFRQSRWFTRGWTLQELIAPQTVLFYDEGWSEIGDKHSLAEELSQITSVDEPVLRTGDVFTISVAKRMSWAAKRETTREEDVAYCLMGLFGVNMPMLYGEGEKAFVRLQEEILKETDDHTIFAWRANSSSAENFPFRGILASSPTEFEGCEDLIPFRNWTANGSLTTVTARGISMVAKLQDALLDSRHVGAALVGLNCKRQGDDQEIVAIQAVGLGGDHYLRSSTSELFSCPSYGPEETVFIAKSTHTTEIDYLPGGERQHAIYIGPLPKGVQLCKTCPPEVRYSPRAQVLEGVWVRGKAAVIFEGPWRKDKLIVLIWMVEVEHSGHFEPSFTALSTRDVDATFKREQKPRRDASDYQLVRIGNDNNNPVSIKLEPCRIQGFDMFRLEVKYAKASQIAKIKRTLSLYSAWKMKEN